MTAPIDRTAVSMADGIRAREISAVVLPAGVGADGLPVGVQLVGARFRDEELLAVAGAVDRVVGAFRQPPGWD